jgi:hypothetical protein
MPVLHPALLSYSVQCQTILLVKWRILARNGLKQGQNKTNAEQLAADQL